MNSQKDERGRSETDTEIYTQRHVERKLTSKLECTQRNQWGAEHEKDRQGDTFTNTQNKERTTKQTNKHL